jgi:hypothetical protein
MIYVLHTTWNDTRRQFGGSEDEYRQALKAFTQAVRSKNGGAALWYGSAFGHWVKLYCTDAYPSTLSEPHRVSHMVVESKIKLEGRRR